MPLRMDPARITIAFELPGFGNHANIRIVRGIIVAARAASWGHRARRCKTIVWRQHHHFHRTVRKNARRRLRADGGTTECSAAPMAIIGMRYERYRGHERRDGSIGVWHGGDRRAYA